jgi:hypothetical protein
MLTRTYKVNFTTQVDTLMKYLIDSLQSYESGHGNALYPICFEPEKSFMSDHIGMKTVTAEEFREMKRSVDRKFDELVGALNSGLSFGISARPSFPLNSGNINLGPIRNAGQLREIRKTVSSPYLSKPANEDSVNDSDVAPKLRKSRSVPIVGVSIPDFGRERGAWRKAIMQWEQGTPDMPHGLALKDWPEAWYTKGMASVTGTKRSQRKLIVDEYNRCVPNEYSSQICEVLTLQITRFGRDDTKFLETYPFADTKPLTHLLHAIRKNHPGKQRNSRNGSPSERDSSPDV